MSEPTEGETGRNGGKSMRKKAIAVSALTLAMTLASVFSVFAETGWKRNGDAWNYYNSNGTMAKNQWVKSGDSLFWIEGDGSMAVNKWLKHDQNWYWFDARGAAATDWQQIDDKWYYFKEDHTMAANETIGSYYVGRDGAWDSSR